MEQIKSQAIGLSLAIATAIGCIAYEKIVKNHSFGVIIFLALAFYIPIFICLLILGKQSLTKEILSITTDTKTFWMCVLYSLTWITAPIWYFITKRQGVLAGSIYEVKYIVILVIFYILFGDGRFTNNTLIGVAFAMLSIYFVSK
jgi:drug/metabolite transporter (DMT)-like permease